MYEFIDRLVNIALPRIKDFSGLNPEGFDNFGNYTFGIKEHIIFPEVNFDKVEKIILNMGLGLDGNDSKIIKSCEDDLSKLFGFNPLKSFILGRAIFTSLSINSYILFFLKVTFNPAFVFFLDLKFDIDFLNFVTTGF